MINGFGRGVTTAHFPPRPCQYSRCKKAIRRIPQCHYQAALLHLGARIASWLEVTQHQAQLRVTLECQGIYTMYDK